MDNNKELFKKLVKGSLGLLGLAISEELLSGRKEQNDE